MEVGMKTRLGLVLVFALAALAQPAGAQFDAALLDLDLPGMDGFALARQLRAQGFSAPLVAVTARREWREERFSALYGEETVRGRREVSVVFADLAGFTRFSEGRDPAGDAARVLTERLEAAGGEGEGAPGPGAAPHPGVRGGSPPPPPAAAPPGAEAPPHYADAGPEDEHDGNAAQSGPDPADRQKPFPCRSDPAGYPQFWPA